MSDFFNLKELKQAATYYNSMPEDDNKHISDCLTIGIDISPNDVSYISVMRKTNDGTFVINRFLDDEAIELYNKLIGKEG